MLSSSALSSVATSAEVVRSSAAEGAVDADGGRLLAGADRYATAVLLAEVPLAAGDAGTGDVLVVSGESLVDAVSAVSVAASRDAAIVLTEHGELPAPVRELLSAREFSSATIGGGINAVSDSVRDELAGLVVDDDDRSSGSSDDRSGDVSSGSDTGASADDVPRVDGATRYDTAVEAAQAAGDPGSWCDTGDTTAVLVNGQSLVDGVIAAPVAYAWELPLLFTEPGVLPDVVADYLREASIERVVAVGSTNDIGAAVTRALEGAGVEVTALNGRTPAARSVQLVEAIEGCATQPVAPGEYALLDANQPVDGVAAAAALATGLGEHSASDDLIPVLAVNQNSVPQPVADYLAEAGERYDTITLYPLGGDARLTPQVISRAVAAAEGEAPDDATDDDAAVEGDVGEPDGAVDGGGEAGDGGDAVMRPPEVDGGGGVPGGPDSGGGQRRAAGGGDAASWLDVPRLTAAEANARWPVESEARDAYMRDAGIPIAPPGADVRLDGRFTTGRHRRGETTSQRYPQGAPSAPTSLNRQDYTLAERHAERRTFWESLPDKTHNPTRKEACDHYLDPLNADSYPGFDCVQVGEQWIVASPRPSYDEAWARLVAEEWGQSGMYRLVAEVGETPGTTGPDAPDGTLELDFEWAVDWYFWACRVLPEIAERVTSEFDFEVESLVAFYDAWFVGAPPDTMFSGSWSSEFNEASHNFARGEGLGFACWPWLRLAELTPSPLSYGTLVVQSRAEAARRWHAAHPQHHRVRFLP